MEIPYRQQQFEGGDRRCGAAALAMVYASLGMADSQGAIWRQIAAASDGKARTARTHLLAQNALGRGLSAVVLQALRPWDLLGACWDSGVRVVLNHRLRLNSPSGHYSVLAGIDGERVILHDPQRGPARQWLRQDFLQLWLPAVGGGEIAGHVLVAIAPQETKAAMCRVCRTPVAEAVACTGCRHPIPLRLAAAMGCLRAGCDARLWKYLFCPYCDAAIGEVGP